MLRDEGIVEGVRVECGSHLLLVAHKWNRFHKWGCKQGQGDQAIVLNGKCESR